MSPTGAVGVDVHRGNAEFKVHYLNLDKSEPPVDPAIILPSRHNMRYLFTIQQHGKARDKANYNEQKGVTIP